MSTDRAGYVAGLRKLADLLDANPDLALPFGGRISADHYSVGTVAEAVVLVSAMTTATAPKIERVNHDDYVVVYGRIHGWSLGVRMEASEVCERRVAGVHKASDGSGHEVVEWVIPPELVAAVEERNRPVPVGLADEPDDALHDQHCDCRTCADRARAAFRAAKKTEAHRG